jgi:hypothetical protein
MKIRVYWGAVVEFHALVTPAQEGTDKKRKAIPVRGREGP